MDPYYGRGTYYRDDYPPARRNPRSYDPQPPVEYARTEQRVYAVPPAPVSYPGPSYNRQVEVRYYDPTTGIGLPVSGPIQPVPAPTVARAPPLQIQMPYGPGSPFEPGQTYKVVGVEEAPVYHAAPPPPRTGYVLEEYPSMPRGPPTRRPYHPY